MLIPHIGEGAKGGLHSLKGTVNKSFYLRLFLLVILLVVLAILGDYWMHEQLGEAKDFLVRWRTQWGLGALTVGGILYLLLLSLPFVPGVELGLLLMGVFGRGGILMVYLSTVGGLTLAFTISRWLPKYRINAWLQKHGISEISSDRSAWIEDILDRSKIGQKFHRRFGPYLWQYRYLTLALLLNLPGNYVLGGGGGIALICGVSGLFRWKWFVLTVMLATAPVPLLAFFGLIQLEGLFGIN